MIHDKPERSEFDSVDPAPPSEDSKVTTLRNTICDEDEKMFQRMRALFALRNIGGKDSVEALAAAFSSKSALLKHEIAYVMGQMQDSHAVPHLIDRLADADEDVMVRHEAAEALGAIGDRTALSVLEEYVDDDEVVVAESCEVALDLLEWVASKRLDYSE
ncbi:MAG: HEAT repeat domain-containing protein [Candidatus Poseidoniales archaeon]|jgi:deoxyhypusine monooxygenase|nr:HEAT repeat domain-containing protein [Candidatus Thalassarchaeaceae archaeon]MDC0184032.1 HEAT repeat domain-containing protein [Candidatus Poseidoniales archaeon]RCH72175.1 MAG: HEAT repeat domain-containing protein [Candidatus Poseidoniales archaeon]DAC70692.1 MAG TPA: HEAT repeat domain-containing protein [Candidatus Poseidoniales archaeon]|tara:strand:- start:4192 stop:4671 length:480 start_codon:yes stop_codon:yes gene_type:complete